MLNRARADERREFVLFMAELAIVAGLAIAALVIYILGSILF